MKTIKLKNKQTCFELTAYKAGETVTVFPGSTGTFGKSAGSKSAGLVYVTRNGTIHAQDNDIDHSPTWDWIQKWMQRGFDSNGLLAAVKDLEAIASLINARQHAGAAVRPDDWSELFHCCNQARAVIASWKE